LKNSKAFLYRKIFENNHTISNNEIELALKPINKANNKLIKVIK